MSDQLKGRAKPELEQLIEANGGKYYQTYDAAPNMICIGDKSRSFRRSHQRDVVLTFARNCTSSVSR